MSKQKRYSEFFSVIGVIIIHSEKKEYEKVFFDCQRCFSLFFFFSGACNLTECNQNCATLKFFRFCNLLFRVLKLNRSHTLATVPRFVTSLIMSLAVPVCNIKRILCSDRQPKWARWAWDCPL